VTHHFVGHLATYMLHQHWKGRDGFSNFMKAAAKLNNEGYVPQSKTTMEIHRNSYGNGSATSKPSYDSDDDFPSTSQASYKRVNKNCTSIK
jgi:hypothetical protein